MKIDRLIYRAAVVSSPLAYILLFQVSAAAGPAVEVGHPKIETMRSVHLTQEAITPIAEIAGLDQEKIRLGRQLFMDPILSRDGSISCASCHDLDTGGDDGRPRSIGIDGQTTLTNAPTVLNAALNFAQFWDGRSKSLEDQIDGPLNSANEMDMSWPEALRRLSDNETYKQAFDAIYADGITAPNVKDAIAEFERSLITPGARFDRYLQGDDAALNEKERRGYRLFSNFGCISCHQGRNIGGNLYQKLGIVRPYFDGKNDLEVANLGRFNVTGEEADRYVFKVPSLRNVSETAPYFHDGSIATLEDAIAIMSFYQLGRTPDATAIDDIAAFLRTLTGKLPVSIQ